MAYILARTRIAPVMVKAETTANYGVDSAPTPATDDLLTFDNSIVAQTASENFAFNPHSKSFTKTKDIIGQRWVDVSINTLFQGSGTLGAQANGTTALGALFESCASKVTITGNTSVVYQPQASLSSLKSATIWVNHDGLIHKMAGCLGTAVLTGTPRQGVKVAYKGMGKYLIPVGTSTTFDTWTGGTNNAAACVGIVGTITGAAPLAGPYSPIFQSFEFDLGVATAKIDDMNAATGMYGMLTTDANPTLNIKIARDTTSSIAEKFYTDWFAAGGTTHSITFKVGSGTGNVCTFLFPTAQIVGITEEDNQGIRVQSLKYKIQHVTPGTEWSITVAST